MARKKKPLVEQFPHITNVADPHGLYQLMLEYLSHQRAQQYSEMTVSTREQYLYRFLEWCGQRNLLRPSEITLPILERFQRHLFHYRKHNGQALGARYQRGCLSTVRLWFRWLMRQRHILYNPASELEMPRMGKRLPKAVLSEAEMERVLNQPDIADPLGVRDRAILETLYSTGIRRTELTMLRLHDVDSERGTLFVRQGKGKRDRMIPIGERALRWIDKYLVEVRSELSCGHDEGALFLNHLGEGISPVTLSSRVRAYVNAAKIGKGGSCHLFRHTMATLMLENGADIRFIQAMLGHVNLGTTEVYTQVSIKKLKEIHTLTHPARGRRGNQAAALDEAPADETQDKAEDMTAEELLATLAEEAEDEAE